MIQTLTEQTGIGAAGEKASAFAHALGARYHAYTQHLDSETYQDPTTHQPRTYQDGDLTGPYYPKSGYHGPQSVSPWQTLTGAGTVVYVNGMNNNLAAHVEAAQATADKEKHPVVGVFNATGITKATKLASTVLGKTWGGRLGTGLGLAADVAQCLSDDEGDFLNNPAITTLVEVLKRGSNRNIVAHSQGTLIVTAALRQLKDKDGKKRRDFSGYHIKFFGSPASTRIVGPNYVDDTSNNDDAVASFAMDGLSLVRNTRRLPKLLLAQVGIHASAFGDNEISRYNNRILTPDRGKFIGPHNYENYENASPTFDELSSGGTHLPSHTPLLEKTTWPATIRALTGYNAWGPATARTVTSASRAVLSGALTGRKWIGSRTHALKNWAVAGANAAFDWSRNEFHAAGRGLGQETQDAGQWMLQNRGWIGDTLHEASTIFGVLAAGLGVTALAIPPTAPFLVPAALTFGAAAAAARAWHSTSLAVGTIDGSVSRETALNEAKWAAVDTALSVATVGVSNARFIARATTVPGMKAVAPVLNNPAKTAVTLNHILQQTNKLFGLKLGLILRNPKLAARLGWVSKALATAKFVKTLVEIGKSRLLGIAYGVAHGIAGGARSAWNFAKDTGTGLLHWGEQKAHQAGSFFHDLKEKYYPSPKHDGDFTGPFFPRGRSPWAGPPPPQSYLRSLVGTGKATLFVNGVNTTYEDHLKTAQRIADDTGSAVVGVFNASGVPSSPKGAAPSKIGTALGLLRDAGQTLSDKLFDRVNRNPAVKAVADLIVQYGNVDKGKGGLRIEAHSQGSVIVSEALRQARDRGADIGSKERGKQVHVNTWGNASWTFPLGPEYHHRVHDSDVIATGLGSSSRFANFVQTNPLAHWIAERFLGPMANAPADTRVLPHAGTGMEPHFVNQALPAGTSGPKPHDYLDDRAKFEKLEQRRQPFSFRTNEQATTRALLPNVTPRKRELVRHGVVAAGRLALPGAATLLGGPLLGRSMALAEGAAMAAPPLARRVSAFGGHTVAPAYGRLDAGVRALPSLPFLPPNTVWGGADTLLRSAGSRVMGFADWLGGGKDRHGPGPALQRSGHGDHPNVNPTALRADLRKQSSGFLPDGNIRARLGGHLGFDPGGARLHTGPAAASASRRLNAEAFTIGNDVFFGEGRFDPHTPKGLGLIAHELTHVGQQTGTTGSKARFFTQEGGDEMEREAQHTAENVLANAGSRSGLFVEDYVREYEGEGGLTQADKQRLDRISVIALREAERMLESHDLHGHINADALDVQVEIDLSEMRDGEAARVWAEAIVREARNGIATPDLSQALKAVTKPTIARQEAESAVTTPAPLTLIVVGSPSPDQGFDLEFVNAAKAQPKNDSTLWLVEKTGYDQKKVDLAKIEEAAKGTAGVAWLTPEHGLPEVINELPDGLIEKMTVFSHGVRGLVALRYGWKDLPDYGLSLDDVKKLKGSKFTETADIEFDSCNSGVKGIGDKASIGQAVANQTGIPVTAWTGRTSYGSINRGGADVEPSTFTGPWRGDFWKELYSRTLSGSSPKKQNFYPQSDANTSSTTSSTPDVPLPMQTDQSGLRRSTLNSTRTDAGPQEQAAQAMEDAIYGHYQATANAMQPTSASQLMIQRNALTCQADSASSAATNPERTSRLDSLQDSISALSQESLQFRAVLDAMPPASSPHRAEVEASLEDHRQSLVTLLEQRIPLLSEEIASLNAQIGPNPTSSSAHPELDALGQALSQRTAELNRNQQQLNPLKRWQMRREMGTIQDQLADIDRELSTISPLSPGANTCDPSNPGSELLVQRRAELARRKREIASALTSTAVRYKQGDPQWGSQNYKQGTQDCPVKDNPPTVAYTGCGPTSLAISLNYLAQEDPERAIPSDVSIVQGAIDHAEGHGRICGRGTAGTAMVSNVQSSWADLRGRTLTLDTAQEELNNGNVVIFLCKDCSGKDAGGTSHSYGGHYMVLNGVNDAGSIFNVLDPAGHNIVTISRAELRNHTGGFWSVTRTDDTVQRQEAPGTPADKGPKEQAADSTGAAVTQAAVIADDPTIDALDLGPKAKAAAKILKQKHPEITLTSGRRSVVEQAHAMASNIVQSKNRNWIKDTYVSASNLQKWVDDNPNAKTVDEIAAGLVTTMGAMSEAGLGKVSKHLSGEAFDVQPQNKDADAIKKDMEALPDESKFLDHEGGLERWHVQFKKRRGPGRYSKGESDAARNEQSASQAEATKAEARLYDPTPKHGRLFGFGTPMDLDDATAQRILDQGVQGIGKQIYSYWNEKVYVFQPDAAGGYHGYPANSPRNVRNEALKLMLERGSFSTNVYHKLRKEVGYG